MSYAPLKSEDRVNKTIYNLRKPIASVFSVIEEILELADIHPKSIYQHSLCHHPQEWQFLIGYSQMESKTIHTEDVGGI